MSGSDADVCVVTEGAAAIKLILRDVNNRRNVRESKYVWYKYVLCENRENDDITLPWVILLVS